MKYIIFDMDGVLINSEPVTMKAASDALLEYGIEHTYDDFKPFIGAGEDKFIIGLSKNAGKEELTEIIMERMYSLIEERVFEELDVYSSAKVLIEELSKRGFRLALASSSALRKLDVSLKAAGIDKDCFDVVLSGTDVKNKKPDPEIYLLAIERLNATPDECLVIEDAVNGIKSAKLAKIKCFAVTTSFNEEILKEAGADFISDDIINVLDYV